MPFHQVFNRCMFPDSPLALQWYRLEDRMAGKVKGEIMLAVWMGTQADEEFSEAWHSDAATVPGEGLANIRSKVYLSLKLWYVRVNVIEVQDLIPSDNARYPKVFIKVILGNQTLKTRVSQNRTINPMWNEDMMFVAAEPFEEHLVLSVEDRVGPNKEAVLGKTIISLQSLDRRLYYKAVNSRWYNLEKHVVMEGPDQKKKEMKTAQDRILGASDDFASDDSATDNISPPTPPPPTCLPVTTGHSTTRSSSSPAGYGQILDRNYVCKEGSEGAWDMAR